jgi:hypothetical protein
MGAAFAVNETTLRYGDRVMSDRWRLLGPQEAVSGTLAFGWSTAAIVTLVIRLFRHRPWRDSGKKLAAIRKKLANPSPPVNGTQHLRLALRLLSAAIVRTGT